MSLDYHGSSSAEGQLSFSESQTINVQYFVRFMNSDKGKLQVIPFFGFNFAVVT